ncbi:SMI1/KNR4 family protein [Williamsia sp. CHRR-6]|uniref:SMI1/KNR4 family protein n=1 Tax=Williamsia sp. CHRR-6 TaxID=2835871 RepID=UPI001BD9AE9E|nr:SMI1/KNR4 family protein [Williamsia sp. CHRR-6]MBT0567976.1 SMI1/KNR4 family protein [Williamsia sp. CHRR-6]
MRLDDSESPISRGDLAPIERMYEAALPTAVTEFYLANNGGYPAGNRVRGDEFIFSINGFHPIKHGALPIEQLARDYLESTPSLAGMLPFAYDDGGNGFMLSLRSHDRGHIYLWLHQEDRLMSVCRDFDTFLAGVYLDE